jgi:flagellar basal body rod protein FlgC
MVDSIGSASNTAVSGIVAAEIQLSTAANNIANGSDGAPPVAPFGSSAVAPPLTGTQPSSASSQVFQALQAASPDQSSSPDQTSGAGGPLSQDGGLTQQALDVATARISFQANVDVLKAANHINQQAINLIT